MADMHMQAAASRGTSLVKIGGALAIAGTIVGTFIFVLACFGFGAAFSLALIPTILGVIALALSLVGGLFQKPIGVEDPTVLAALLLSIAVVAGGLLEMAIWLNKPIFASATGL
ncbi:MAG: hypothetical protein ABIP55_14070 [Tepidisphaeraceae bacterium]